jgi:phosphomannomutase
MYYDHARENFDLDSINKSGISVAFDAMYGASQKIFRRLVPTAELHRCNYNPSFKGIAPEPIPKNLKSFARLIDNDEHIDIGIATDGDGDRIGVLDSNGDFIDSHHLILMLIQYLVKYKELKGQVITTFSCTSKIAKLCRKFDLPHKITPIGFKYIAGHMVRDKVLVGGEESGGIALSTHIPERDGIWVGLTLLEYMANVNLKLEDLMDRVYEDTGKFWVDRNDLHIDEETKKNIIEQCANNEFTQFGDYKVTNSENLDGFKFFFGEDRWVLIRPSGTEPVLRVYAEGRDRDEALSILEATKATLNV